MTKKMQAKPKIHRILPSFGRQAFGHLVFGNQAHRNGSKHLSKSREGFIGSLTTGFTICL